MSTFNEEEIEALPEHLKPVYDQLVLDGLIQRKVGPMGSFDVMTDEGWKKLMDAQYEYAQEEYRKLNSEKKESTNDTTNEK